MIRLLSGVSASRNLALQDDKAVEDAHGTPLPRIEVSFTPRFLFAGRFSRRYAETMDAQEAVVPSTWMVLNFCVYIGKWDPTPRKISKVCTSKPYSRQSSNH